RCAGLHRMVSARDVEGDVSRKHLQSEPDTELIKRIQYGIEPIGEILKTPVDHPWLIWRKGVQEVPDRATREHINDLDTQLRRRPRRVLQLLGGSLAHAIRIAIPPASV